MVGGNAVQRYAVVNARFNIMTLMGTAAEFMRVQHNCARKLRDRWEAIYIHM